MSKKFSRRDFIKGMAAGAVGITAMGVTNFTASAASDDMSWDKEADVVIVGGGGTGLTAAVVAAKAGASVLILEKSEAVGGTTIRSGAVIQAAGTDFQKENSDYKDDTPEIHAEYYIQAGEGRIDEELIKDITANAPNNIVWLSEEIGIEWESIYGGCKIPYVDDELFADRIHRPVGGATTLIANLTEVAEGLGVVIECETEATNLVQDDTKRVIGVKAMQGGAEITVKANMGVLLAAASIDNNEEMAKALSPQQYWDITTQVCVAAATDTGDGIRMGMEIGADICGISGSIDYNGTTGLATTNEADMFPAFIVNMKGKRFMCEESTYAYGMRAIFNEEMKIGGPTYMIFTSSSLESENAAGVAESLDSLIESEMVMEADSIEALAGTVGINPDVLAATFAEWNEYAGAGEDKAFERTEGLEVLEGDKYYALKMVSYNLGSLGGLKINKDTEVLDVNGEVIPGLYSAGLNAGGWIGNYYPSSGTAIMGCIQLGKRAGEVMTGTN